MKYGQGLTEKMNPVWQKYNIEFHQLIQQLKLKHGEKWKMKDEEAFKKSLEKEIIKVCDFLQIQVNKAIKQLQHLETTHFSSSSPFQIEQKEKEKITSFIFYIHDISNYLLNNKNGLNKMITKHDQYYVQFTLKQYYHQHIQTQFLTFEQQLDHLFLRSSKLYDIYRSSNKLPSSSSSLPMTMTTTDTNTKQQQQHHHRHHQTNHSLSSTSTSSTLSPITTSSLSSSHHDHPSMSFWVHPHHINELKAILLFYLPILSSPQQEQQNKNQFHTEDSPSSPSPLSLTLLNCQWYNNHLSEMKMEYEEQSQSYIKKSILLDGTTLSTCFYNNNHNNDDHTFTSFIDNNNKKENDTFEIIRWIQQKKLIPQCQTTCQRTIYSSSQPSFEIYLDTNIQFSEMNSSTTSSSFPYGLLTLSSSTSSLPSWLNDILSSHLVYSVPRFSFYIHIQSFLYTSQLPIHPYWLSIKEKDLLSKKNQPHQKQIGLSRTWMTLQPLINGHRFHSFDQDHSIIHFDPSMDQHQQQQQYDHHKEKGKTIYYQFKYWIKEKCFIMNQQKNKTMILKNNKLTEPKTHFANERTFITWLQLCATFLVISLNLINHGDWVSRTMGSVLIFICCLLSIYALGRFQYRGWQLRTRKYVLRYDDVMGPTLLCGTLILAMTMNLYFRYPLIIEAIQSL
ncbi:unnamed protein product [Cunninghamella blakesleeana]